jgi:hypothetical protein
MLFLKVAVLALFPLLQTVLAAPSRRQSTSGTITSPVDGTHIAPGAAFDFAYESVADFGVTSYNVCGFFDCSTCTDSDSIFKYTVWLLTSMPTSFAQSTNFAEGHYFGRFAEPNFPGSTSSTYAVHRRVTYRHPVEQIQIRRTRLRRSWLCQTFPRTPAGGDWVLVPATATLRSWSWRSTRQAM